MEKPSFERAQVQYALAHNLQSDAVTRKMLEDSAEGLEHWACVGIDCKARGWMGNAMYRQLRKFPEVQESYKWLFDDLKLKFRQTWAIDRNFEFISRKRVKSISTSTRQEEIGTWKNELQLQVHFGGTDQPEAKRQASCYINKCRNYKDGLYVFIASSRTSAFAVLAGRLCPIQ